MQINGKVKGKFLLNIRYQDESALREGIAVMHTKVAKHNGATVWGDDFMAVAFANMIETDDGPKWNCRALTKPALVCEVLQVEINGQTFEVQPEIPNIKPIEGEAAVMVPLRMRFDLKTEKLAGKVAFAVGEGTELVFDAKQLAVPGSNANAPTIRRRKGKHGNPESVRA